MYCGIIFILFIYLAESMVMKEILNIMGELFKTVTRRDIWDSVGSGPKFVGIGIFRVPNVRNRDFSGPKCSESEYPEIFESSGIFGSTRLFRVDPIILGFIKIQDRFQGNYSSHFTIVDKSFTSKFKELRKFKICTTYLFNLKKQNCMKY